MASRPPVPKLIAPTADNTVLTSDEGRDCTPDCIPDAKTSNGATPDNSVHYSFDEALAIIARLPLTEAEKAEAVRRLLTDMGQRS